MSKKGSSTPLDDGSWPVTETEKDHLANGYASFFDLAMAWAEYMRRRDERPGAALMDSAVKAAGQAVIREVGEKRVFAALDTVMGLEGRFLSLVRKHGNTLQQ